MGIKTTDRGVIEAEQASRESAAEAVPLGAVTPVIASRKLLARLSGQGPAASAIAFSTWLGETSSMPPQHLPRPPFRGLHPYWPW